METQPPPYRVAPTETQPPPYRDSPERVPAVPARLAHLGTAAFEQTVMDRLDRLEASQARTEALAIFDGQARSQVCSKAWARHTLFCDTGPRPGGRGWCCGGTSDAFSGRGATPCAI
ncbi:hypothetical protein NKR19_g8748 [Coniochaeta hoffmannii]|uniref:Uncharacterized protein n=1 Tax=Coniochaeta hoffmannii TaxID=91930 RepID=A0AA38RDI2_9PEZI|nr:hypothetical protein NKR19_g8748 [Coniochaeta hoffmannii]